MKNGFLIDKDNIEETVEEKFGELTCGAAAHPECPDRYGKTGSVSLSSLIGATPQASPSSALPGCRQVLESGERTKASFDRKTMRNCIKWWMWMGKKLHLSCWRCRCIFVCDLDGGYWGSGWLLVGVVECWSWIATVESGERKEWVLQRCSVEVAGMAIVVRVLFRRQRHRNRNFSHYLIGALELDSLYTDLLAVFAVGTIIDIEERTTEREKTAPAPLTALFRELSLRVRTVHVHRPERLGVVRANWVWVCVVVPGCVLGRPDPLIIH